MYLAARGRLPRDTRRTSDWNGLDGRWDQVALSICWANPTTGDSGDHRSADLTEIVGQVAPTNPALHAGFAAVAAAVQPKAPIEHANATFDASSPPVGAAKRATLGPCVLSPDRSLPRQGDGAHVEVLGELLVGDCEERSLAGEHCRRASKTCLMVSEAAG